MNDKIQKAVGDVPQMNMSSEKMPNLKATNLTNLGGANTSAAGSQLNSTVGLTARTLPTPGMTNAGSPPPDSRTR